MFLKKEKDIGKVKILGNRKFFIWSGSSSSFIFYGKLFDVIRDGGRVVEKIILKVKFLKYVEKVILVIFLWFWIL